MLSRLQLLANITLPVVSRRVKISVPPLLHSVRWKRQSWNPAVKPWRASYGCDFGTRFERTPSECWRCALYEAHCTIQHDVPITCNMLRVPEGTTGMLHAARKYLKANGFDASNPTVLRFAKYAMSGLGKQYQRKQDAFRVPGLAYVEIVDYCARFSQHSVRVVCAVHCATLKARRRCPAAYQTQTIS